MKEQLKLVIADDHRLVTESLSEFLLKNIDCKIVFTASNGRELMDRLGDEIVDVILLDLKMPKMDGIECLKQIRIQYPEQKVIIVSMLDDENTLLKLIKLKVNGYLSKSGSGEEMLIAINAVMKKGYYFNDELNKVIYKEASNDYRDHVNIDPKMFDDIDIGILKMISNEMTSEEIADKLFVSRRTIEGRRRRLLETLGVKNQIGLVLYSIKSGIVEL